MNINQLLTNVNRKVASNKINKWIVIHYTANNGDTAKGNCNYFSKEYRGASANYFVDENEIWQCVEGKDIAWHVGANKYYNNCRNDNSIGIELCSRIDKNGQYYFKDKTILNAVELTKMLMKKYNIGIDHVCRHYDVTRKICPAPFVNDPEAWKSFLKRLENKMEDFKTYEEARNYLQEQNIIDSPDFWNKVNDTTKNIDKLFIKFANAYKNK